MNVWPKQKRAALLEWRGSTQSSSSEQGGSHGQYTRTEATATLPNKAVPIPTWSRFREAAPVSAAAAGTRSADTATGADERTAGAAGAATADSGFAFRFHPPDLLPHRGLVAGGPPHRRQSHHSQCAADRRRVEHRSCLQLSSRLLALALVDVLRNDSSSTSFPMGQSSWSATKLSTGIAARRSSAKAGIAMPCVRRIRTRHSAMATSGSCWRC